MSRAEPEPDWASWRRPRPTAAEQRWDVWVALAVFAGAMVGTMLINSMGPFPLGVAPSLSEQLLWGAALAVPLVVRRRFPVPVLIVVGAMFIAGQFRQNGDTFTPAVALFLAIYTAGAWERNRMAARWARIGVVVAMFTWLGYGLARFLLDPRPDFGMVAGPLDPVLASVLYSIGFNLVFFGAAYVFGNIAWVSARREAELAQRARELRDSQEQNLRGAVVAERVRIARDLHDVVAHHVSVMGVQAGAARRVFDTDHDLARSALHTVEETARTAIGELRSLLGVLRAEPADAPAADAEHSASPGLEQLPELVTAAGAAGLDVRHGTFGEPRAVPDGVALSAYRVVQEALTNVVKHSRARTADVRVRFLDTSLEVEVTDDGLGAAAARQRGSGFGLLGMQERVAVHGGELEAGPRQGTGFRVRARFPSAMPDSSIADSVNGKE
ncbi:sensor histidine kinase [Saccharomonospora sp. NPDC046836]|uniref:sensor histidine kinase n=1 Tax=Saccharomonospora sp. NPDC046836 TaxID=3156921 RepID=UPI00340401DC